MCIKFAIISSSHNWENLLNFFLNFRVSPREKNFSRQRRETNGVLPTGSADPSTTRERRRRKEQFCRRDTRASPLRKKISGAFQARDLRKGHGIYIYLRTYWYPHTSVRMYIHIADVSVSSVYILRRIFTHELSAHRARPHRTVVLGNFRLINL